MTGTLRPQRRAARDAPELVWTGRLRFDVTTPKGGHLGMLELVLRREDVEVVYAGRNLAVLDRERLRRWLRRPLRPLDCDDVVLDMNGRRVTMAMDLASPLPLPDRIVTQLNAIV